MAWKYVPWIRNTNAFSHPFKIQPFIQKVKFLDFNPDIAPDFIDAIK